MKEKYWKKNILYLRILLTIWFISSFGFGILFAEDLNSILPRRVSSWDFGLHNKAQSTYL